MDSVIKFALWIVLVFCGLMVYLIITEEKE